MVTGGTVALVTFCQITPRPPYPAGPLPVVNRCLAIDPSVEMHLAAC